MFYNQHVPELIEYLKTASAAERHFVALHYNWESGLAVPAWLIEQPDCDQATAIEIFWLTNVSAAEITSEEIFRNGRPAAERLYVLWLCSRIIEKWNNKQFRERKFAFPDKISFSSPEKLRSYFRSEKDAESRCDKSQRLWTIPQEFGQEIEGQKVGPDVMSEELEILLNQTGTYFGRKWVSGRWEPCP